MKWLNTYAAPCTEPKYIQVKLRLAWAFCLIMTLVDLLLFFLTPWDASLTLSSPYFWKVSNMMMVFYVPFNII